MIIKPIRSCLWARARVMATLGIPLNNVDLVWLTFEAVWLFGGSCELKLFNSCCLKPCRALPTQPHPRVPGTPRGTLSNLTQKHKFCFIFFQPYPLYQPALPYKDTGPFFLLELDCIPTSWALIASVEHTRSKHPWKCIILTVFTPFLPKLLQCTHFSTTFTLYNIKFKANFFYFIAVSCEKILRDDDSPLCISASPPRRLSQTTGKNVCLKLMVLPSHSRPNRTNKKHLCQTASFIT